MSGRDSRPSRYRGTEMTDKQFDGAVRHGQEVMALTPSGSTVRGYVFGVDGSHVSIVTPDLRRHLVPRSSSFEFGEPGAYEVEPRHTELERYVAPYRKFVAQLRGWSSEPVPAN